MNLGDSKLIWLISVGFSPACVAVAVGAALPAALAVALAVGGPDESDRPDRPDVGVAVVVAAPLIVSVALVGFLLYRVGQLKRA